MFYPVSYDLDLFLRNNSAGSDPERHTRRREVKDEVRGLMVRGKKQVRKLYMIILYVDCHMCNISERNCSKTNNLQTYFGTGQCATTVKLWFIVGQSSSL